MARVPISLRHVQYTATPLSSRSPPSTPLIFSYSPLTPLRPSPSSLFSPSGGRTDEVARPIRVGQRPSPRLAPRKEAHDIEARTTQREARGGHREVGDTGHETNARLVEKRVSVRRGSDVA